MIFRVLAYVVVALHLAFVAFVVLGGLLALRWRGVVRLHLPAAAWGVAIEWCGWVCPLTPLENWLRRLGGEAGYAGGFLERYALAVLYPEGLTRETQIALGCVALSVNVAVYATLWSRGRGLRKAPGRNEEKR